MKNSKAILLAICASLFAVLTVVNMSLASPKSAGENTLDMLEIMTRAFDESEGGEGQDPEIGGEGTCGYRVWCTFSTPPKFVIECGVNQTTAMHMMGLCDLGVYEPPCNWCCESCSSTTYCGNN